MKIAYFDCISGMSGDMLAGALIDAGLDLSFFKKELRKVAVDGYAVRAERQSRLGISGTRFIVELKEAGHGHEHGNGHAHGRSFSDIVKLIRASRLAPAVKDDVIDIFKIVARAEGKIHNRSMNDVHFHEVGAVDSIIDIVCAAVGIRALGIQKACASQIPAGSGVVRCAHGVFPVPAPATAEILKGIPLVKGAVRQELVTPTGAAIIRHFVSSFDGFPQMQIGTIGYGVGSKDFKEIPNIFRLMIGEAPDTPSAGDTAYVIESNIDDINPQIYEYLSEKLFAAGARDVWLTPISMKKMRPAVMLSVLAEPATVDTMTGLIFAETTTLGIRIRETARKVLERRKKQVRTPYGPVSVKLGFLDGTCVSANPEYEDCKKIARRRGVALKEVMRAAAASCHMKK